VGGLEEFSIECRIIAAASPHLEQVVASGEFREDLYYRLNVFSIVLPPLRERLDDVKTTAQHFLEWKHLKGQPRKEFSAEAMQALMVHRWPGNVRELKNVIERAGNPERRLARRAPGTPDDSAANSSRGGARCNRGRDSDSGGGKVVGGHRARGSGAHAQAHEGKPDGSRADPRNLETDACEEDGPPGSLTDSLTSVSSAGQSTNCPPAVAALIERAQQSERSGRRELSRHYYESALYLLTAGHGEVASSILRRIARTHVDDGQFDVALDCLAACVSGR
jgi:hypothetical protein